MIVNHGWQMLLLLLLDLGASYHCTVLKNLTPLTPIGNILEDTKAGENWYNDIPVSDQLKSTEDEISRFSRNIQSNRYTEHGDQTKTKSNVVLDHSYGRQARRLRAMGLDLKAQSDSINTGSRPIDSKRIAEIITAMRTEYEILLKSLDILKRKERSLIKHGSVIGIAATITDILQELKYCYKTKILELVRHRIMTLYGLVPRIIGLSSEPKPNTRNSNSKSNDKVIKLWSSKSHFWLKNRKRKDVGKRKEKSCTVRAQAVGKSGHKSELSSETLSGQNPISKNSKNKEVLDLYPGESSKCRSFDENSRKYPEKAKGKQILLWPQAVGKGGQTSKPPIESLGGQKSTAMDFQLQNKDVQDLHPSESFKFLSSNQTKRKDVGKGKEKQGIEMAHPVAKPGQMPSETSHGQKPIAMSHQFERKGFEPGQSSNQQEPAHTETKTRPTYYGYICEFINEKIRSDVVQTLNHVLRAVDFPQLLLAPDVANRKKIVRLKVRFEKLVFLALDYLYKFDLIEREEMVNFFWNQDTLDLTARHLRDLYGYLWNPFFAYHPFIPNLHFILTDWHSEHLHLCLADLDESAHRRLVYVSLRLTIEAFDLVERPPHWNICRESSSMNDDFLAEDFLVRFEGWSIPRPNHQPVATSTTTRPDLLIQEIERRINYFQFPPNPLDETEEKVRKVEYLVNYHILHFLKYHGNQQMKTYLKNSSNYRLFWKQFEMIRLGLGVLEHLNMYFDYGYFLVYPTEAKHRIPKQVTTDGAHLLISQIRSLSKAYKTSYRTVDHILASPNNQIRMWPQRPTVKAILKALSQVAVHLRKQAKMWNRNTWLMTLDKHRDIETDSYEEYLCILNHLRTHFNLPGWYAIKGAFEKKVRWRLY